jgi:hypothetical protein
MNFKNLSFEEKELSILRDAVDKNQKLVGKKMIDDPLILKIIDIVEEFLANKKRICYGGTAINNILPIEDQFYDKAAELPDYDFFSPEPYNDAIELADIYYNNGFTEVSAQSGMHPGTYKVFVNFIPVADITELVPELFKNLQKDSIIIDGIHYSSPNFLRMLGYLELSRPLGDTSRWEKVLKRINLLNKNYPLKGLECEKIDIQRLYDGNREVNEEEKTIFEITRTALINRGVVFFGALASKMILKYLPNYRFEKIPNVPDFDVLSENPLKVANFVKERLKEAGIKKIKIIKRKNAGEVISDHYEIIVDNETIVFIFKPLGCLSYNDFKHDGKKIRIATIDTLLNLYLAFLYTDRPYFDDKRILCISELMFKVQQRNRLKQKGLLRRFNIKCYGSQKTIEDLRAEKSEKYKELKDKNDIKEWNRYFLRYQPGQQKKITKKKTKKRRKKKKKNKNIFGL